MRARPPPPPPSFFARASWLLVAATWGGGGGTGFVQGVSAAPAVPGRWGQSSLLLTPVDDPTFLIFSGKTYIAGQTLTSTPTVSSSLTLSLASPIDDLTSPPWVESTALGPISAYGSSLALSFTTALFFGGDATGDSNEVVQSGNDSSWILSYPRSTVAQNWTHQAAGWAGQPMRREEAYTASATNGSVSRGWVYGGMRSDGSGVGLGELWEVQMGVGKAGVVQGGEWAQWSVSGSADISPPPMWDGQAVLVPSSKIGGFPSVYLIGGAQNVDGVTSLASMSSVWVFTPGETMGSGAWSQVAVDDAPEPRRGHVAVAVGDGKIWIQGGRTLDGSAVRSDSAMLDTIDGSWTTTAVGQAVWGHSAVSIGETVLMAFGYGINAPASTSLTVYAPGNDTFLTSYSPSYEVIVLNPKARQSSVANSAAPTGPAAPDDTEAAPLPSSTLVTGALTTEWVGIGTSTQAAAGTSPTAAPDPADSSPSSPSPPPSSPSSAPWVAPGGPSSSDPSSSNDPSSSDDPNTVDSGDSSAPTTPKSKAVVAGAVVGSLLGALAVIGVGFIALRRRQRRQGRGPYAYPALSEGRRRGGGGYGGWGEGSGSLMAESGGAGAMSSEAYNGSHLEKALPPIAGRGSHDSPRVGTFFAAAAAGLGLAKGGPKTPKVQPSEKGRFAMLEDEESEAWDSLNSQQRERRAGWTTFFDGEGEGEDVEAGSVKGRGGRGVWDGYDFGAAGGMGAAGKVVSDTVQSGRSFLTGALGGFVPIASQDQHEEEDRRLAAIAPQAALTPINEEFADDEHDGQLSSNDHTTETAGTRSSGTHVTHSTVPTSGAGSNGNLSLLASAPHTTPTRPFSPASTTTSLYGSGFHSPSPRGAPLLAGAAGGMSRSSSTNSDLDFLNRSKSSSSARWWGRLAGRGAAAADEPTSTASERIRDPAPPPTRMEVIEEKLGGSPLASSNAEGHPLLALADPFADPTPPSTCHAHADLTQPDEQGRLSSRALQLAHNRSVSSNASSQRTATSSVLEERMRGMDVVQRMRTGSGSTVSADTTPRLGGGEGGGFGRLPDRSVDDGAEEEEIVEARKEAATMERGRLIFAGSAAGSYRTTSPEPLRSPTSPRRHLGPRPPPPSLSVTIPKPTASPTSSRTAPLTAGAAGVRAMVQQFEQQGKSDLPRSSSMSAVVVEPTSPSKAARRSTLGGGGGGGAEAGARKKVQHGLARKPVLYVANPDE